MEGPMEEPMDEQQQYETGQPEDDQPVTFTDQVTGEVIEFGPGFAGTVTAGQDMNISRAGGVIVSAGQDMEASYGGGVMINAGRDMELSYGGAMMMNVGNNMSVTNGGAQILNVGGNLDVVNGGGLVLTSNNATVKNGYLGIVISKQTNLEEGTKVLLDTKQAIAFGAAFGVVAAVLGVIFRKR